MKHARLRALTLAYAALLVAIIAAANHPVHGQTLGRWRGRLGPGSDKVGHFVLFGLLAWLADASLAGRRLRLGPLRPRAGIALVALAAVLEEASQAALPTRNFDLLDLGASLAGIGLAQYLARPAAPAAG